VASAVSFEDLERRNLGGLNVLKGMKAKLSSYVHEILSEYLDRHQALNDLREKIEAVCSVPAKAGSQANI